MKVFFFRRNIRINIIILNMMPIYRKQIQFNSLINAIKIIKDNKLKPNLFDVSLRDGLQSKKNIYNLEEKKKILHDIINLHYPKSIEVGSLVSDKILPQMSNSVELFNYAESINKDIDFYVLIPNLEYTKKAIKCNIKNMSFITSVSNEFQLKNIKKSLKETKNEITSIIDYTNNKNVNKKKLYISCINQCPISGIIDNNYIVDEILFYHNMNAFDELCLSDTCGKLNISDFQIIIDSLLKHISPNKLSLHLHMSKNFNNLKDIIAYSFNNNINNFDISILNSGGCSVTMENDELNNNLTYDVLYSIIDDQ